MKTLILDIESPIFRSTVRHERLMIVNGKETPSTNIDAAFKDVEDYISGLKDKFNTDKIICTLGGKNNFRKSVLPEYKANRTNMRKPIGLKELGKLVKANYKTIIHPNMEADDVCGILATSDERIIKGDRAIVSIDKDMQQIPCELYNSDTEELKTTDTLYGDYFFLKQVIIGDITDNYKGLPKGGVKLAEKILDKTKNIEYNWKQVVKAYEKKGFTEQDALVQARCARILRASDYDFDKKEVILWKIGETACGQ